jgi:hypothetical protein
MKVNISDNSSSKTQMLLTYAGAFSFVFFAICVFFDIQNSPIFGNVIQSITIYGLIIASFMAGAHWGQQLNLKDKPKLLLQITSNINAIVLWIGYLNLSSQNFIFILILSFYISLKVDYSLYQNALIKSGYFLCTCIPVTIIVIISLLIMRFYV